jgi:hypothetical protein
MSIYVMVSADFPGTDTQKRDNIYKCLRENDWIKVTQVGRDISTVWYAKFKDEVSNEEAIRVSKQEFINCSKSYTTPKLAIHAGPQKPVIY